MKISSKINVYLRAMKTKGRAEGTVSSSVISLLSTKASLKPKNERLELENR